MSLYYGNDAINYLAKKSQKKDTKSSSHWNKFHADFSFNDGDFLGIKGFGNNKKKYTGLTKIAHHIVQKPFRKTAEQFSSFPAINKTIKYILNKQNKGYSLDVLRQVISLAYLNDKKIVKENGISCVIGDGFATMTSLLLKHSKQRVVLVNLSKTLLVDLYYLRLLLGDRFASEVVLVADKDSLLEILLKTESKPSVIAIEAENHELIQLCPIDLTINIASMQEMNPEVVEEYFTDISVASKRHNSVFYCCNREEKVLPDGTMVKFENYPWNLSDEVLEDELCPWHQKYYSIKLPFYHNYDGAIRHRLARFR